MMTNTTTNDEERLAAAATLAGLNHSNHNNGNVKNLVALSSLRGLGTNSTRENTSSEQKPPISVVVTNNNNNQEKKKSKKRHVEETFHYPVEPVTVQIIKKPRTIMNHSYRDFSKVPADCKDEIPDDIANMTFPQKVHHILSQPEYSDFVSWMPHGRSFKTHLPKVFEQTVCKKYFGHCRYSSFLRQLANYGFKHITQGKDRNCYYHEVSFKL